jgi:hypothetical protein
MSPTANEKTQATIRTVLPIVGLAVAGLIWGIRLEGKINTHIAVDTQDAIHIKESLSRIEADGKVTELDVKDIKAYLMKSPP